MLTDHNQSPVMDLQVLIDFSRLALTDELAWAPTRVRDAAKGFCRFIIYSRFGQRRGSELLAGPIEHDGVARSVRSGAADLSTLISIVTSDGGHYEPPIQDRLVRQKTRSYLETIRITTRASLDTPDVLEAVKVANIQVARYALAKLLIWLCRDFVRTKLPPDLAVLTLSAENEYLAARNELCSFEGVRGSQIVRICHPKATVALEMNPDGRESFEFVTAEVAPKVLLGFVFLKKISVVSSSFEYFRANLPKELATLWVCCPRAFDHKSGREIDRLASVKRIFRQTLPGYLDDRVQFSYIDDFVWAECLGEEVRSRPPQLEYEYKYIDQDLFPFGHPEGKEDSPVEGPLGSSLKYVQLVLDSKQKDDPIIIVAGRAGVGKSTFCEQVLNLVNRSEKKRAILIPANDLRNSHPDFIIGSVTDLYRFYIKSVDIESREILEPDNFEINVSCGNIILIIDGLDEIESQLKDVFDLDSFLESAIALNDVYNNSSIIITSRDYHIGRFAKNESTAVVTLLGFDEDMVRHYIVDRLDESKVNEANGHLRKLEASQSLYTPLYLTLICDMIEREGYDTGPLPDIAESKYFYAKYPLDTLLFGLIKREISKQSLTMTCDNYFELLLEISVRLGGSATRSDFNLYVNVLLPEVDATSNKSGDEYPQFYVSPLLTSVGNSGDGFVPIW